EDVRGRRDVPVLPALGAPPPAADPGGVDERPACPPDRGPVEPPVGAGQRDLARELAGVDLRHCISWRSGPAVAAVHRGRERPQPRAEPDASKRESRVGAQAGWSKGRSTPGGGRWAGGP